MQYKNTYLCVKYMYIYINNICIVMVLSDRDSGLRPKISGGAEMTWELN